MNRIRKIWNYLTSYGQNKKTLRILEERTTTPLYLRHLHKVLKYTVNHKQSAEQMLSQMVISYHSIEKGLAMSEKRYGFGQPKMRKLVSLCNLYLDTYGDYPSRLEDTLGVIAEYDQLHKEQGVSLREDLQLSIDDILQRTEGHWHLSHTRHITKQVYFENIQKSFAQFSASRHSIRDFDGTEVPKAIMDKAFDLAQNAPSACNRQATRVYAVYDKQLIEKLVDLQNHGRGFADNARPLLVIATELQSWGCGEEWFGGYVDAGIYIMNLLYALHYHQVAAIPLNWYADEESQQQIHELLNIHASQEVVAFIACGNPKEEFNLVTSKRRKAKEIVTYL